MKKSKGNCDLQSCFLCKFCLPEWLPAVAANKKTIHYKKSEVIFKKGEEVKGIFFVFEGTVKVHKQWGSEKELIIRFAKKGDIIGHRGLGSEVIYPVSGTAIEATTVCFVDLQFFKTTLSVNNSFTIELLMFYADELQRSERKMNHLAHMQVKGRIAYSLLSLYTKFGVTSSGAINITLSRQDIASYAGTTYETVFRMLTEFAQDGIIAVDNKDITLLDISKLEHLIKET